MKQDVFTKLLHEKPGYGKWFVDMDDFYDSRNANFSFGKTYDTGHSCYPQQILYKDEPVGWLIQMETNFLMPATVRAETIDWEFFDSGENGDSEYCFQGRWLQEKIFISQLDFERYVIKNLERIKQFNNGTE